MGKLHFKRQYWQHFQSCQKEAEDLSAIRAPIVLVIPTPAMVPAKDTDTPMRTVASTSTRGKGTWATPALLGVRSLPMDSGTLPPTTTTTEPATPRPSRSTRTVYTWPSQKAYNNDNAQANLIWIRLQVLYILYYRTCNVVSSAN